MEDFRSACIKCALKSAKTIKAAKDLSVLNDLSNLNVIGGAASAALGGAAGGADEAAFLVDESLVAAVGAALSRRLGAVGQIFLECALDTHLPRVDRLAVELETAHEL